jgi:hypothetical protein
MKKCKFCNKRLWFSARVDGMHIPCFITQRYQLLEEYIRIREVLFHIEQLPFSTEWNKGVSQKEYEKMLNRKEELECILNNV